MMNMGVPYDLYWYGDPFAVRHYVDAYELEQERRAELYDFQAWLYGSYVHEAVGAVVATALSGKKATYPSQPRNVTRRNELDEEAALKAAFAEMLGVASVYNGKLRKKTDANGGGVTTT